MPFLSLEITKGSNVGGIEPVNPVSVVPGSAILVAMVGLMVVDGIRRRRRRKRKSVGR